MNKTNVIKIACDFVCIENLDAMVEVSKELCRCRLFGTGEDILQLLLTLWHAWNHLDTISMPLMTSSVTTQFTCPICKNPFVFRNGLLHHL